MNLWRYSHGNEPSDPIDTIALLALFRNQTLLPDTLVWKDGMPDWAPARTVPDFAPIFETPPAPPPLPPNLGNK